MSSEGLFSISVASVVEDVIKQHGSRLSDIDLASRKAEEAATRRYEAAAWLRRTVGVVGAKDLPEAPSEDEFRVGVRNGMILCNALNKVVPGAVPKVVEIPVDSNIVPDGAAISAFQYFENVRNFLVVMEDMGLPTFQASDLEQGGKGSRVVNSVLALKSYHDRKNSSAKIGGISKPASSGKYFMRKNSEPFMNSLSKNQSGFSMEQNLSADFLIESTEMTTSHSLNMLVSAVLSNKKPEEVPLFVESMLSKVMQEFERRLASQKEQMRTTLKDLAESKKSFSEPDVPEELSSASVVTKMEMEDMEDMSPVISKTEDTSTILKKEDDSDITKEDDSDITKIEDQEDSSPTSFEEHDSSFSRECDSSSISKKEEEALAERKEEEAALAKRKKEECDSSSISKKEEAALAERKKEEEALAERKKEEAALAKRKKEEAAALAERKKEEAALAQRKKEEAALAERLMRQRVIFDRQQGEIQELKHALHATRSGMELLKSQYYAEFGNLGKHFKILAHAATGYHKVLEENRKLYNQVQDLKGNIRVYCRVRPFLPGQANGATTIGRIDDGSITINTPPKYGKEGHKSFTFNKVFGPSATQGAVFVDTQPLIRSVLDGYNVCIFAYGQTGSGKTFTMTGPKELSEETLGVNYRALNDLFSLSEQRRDTFRYEISVQMMEIYNEQVRDLLVTDGLQKKLEIRNNSQNGLSVPDANMLPVSTTSDVIELMTLGHKNRAVCSTAMNDRSSRSHSCVTVHVQGRDLTSGTTIRGSMHLVDLAGSERVDKSEVKGDRLKEAVHINKSLSALGDVIAALAQKNSHVPYRNSKLTQLLQDSLGGQAKTLMFIHISPEFDTIGETISTLKFAERVATVELGAARTNKENPEVKELKEQIATLKAALARKGGDTDNLRSTVSSPDIFKLSPGSASPSQHEDVGFDVGNMEVHNDTALRQKKESYDFQELLTTTGSPRWGDQSPRTKFQKGYEKEMGPGEWVDKVMVNKHEALIRDDDSLKDWEGDSTSAPDFYQRYSPDMRAHYEQYQRNASGSVTTDDSDDLDIATSDSSEADMHWQLNPSKIPSVIHGGVSTAKKPQPKTSKSLESRIPSRSHIPSPVPARKASNGASQIPNRPGSGKRSTTGKTGSGK